MLTFIQCLTISVLGLTQLGLLKIRSEVSVSYRIE